MDGMRILFAAIGFAFFGAVALAVAGLVVGLVVIVLYVAFSVHWFLGAVVSAPVFLALLGLSMWATRES